MSFLRLATRATTSLPRSTFAAAQLHRQLVLRASFSAAAGLSKDVIQARVFDVLKGFEKVDPSKVRYDYHLAPRTNGARIAFVG